MTAVLYFRLYLVIKPHGIEYSIWFLWVRNYLCYRNPVRIFCYFL